MNESKSFASITVCFRHDTVTSVLLIEAQVSPRYEPSPLDADPRRLVTDEDLSGCHVVSTRKSGFYVIKVRTMIVEIVT